MKILHTLHWIQFAGTEKVCVDLCNEMSKGHQVYLLSNEKIRPYLNNAVQLIDFDFEKNRYNPLFLYQTAKLLEKIAPDIIHCHNTKEIEIMKYAQLFLTKKSQLSPLNIHYNIKRNITLQIYVSPFWKIPNNY